MKAAAGKSCGSMRSIPGDINSWEASSGGSEHSIGVADWLDKDVDTSVVSCATLVLSPSSPKSLDPKTFRFVDGRRKATSTLRRAAPRTIRGHDLGGPLGQDESLLLALLVAADCPPSDRLELLLR